MLKTGDIVLLQKLAANSPEAEAAANLPTGYWLKGKLASDLRVGATIMVERHERAARPEDGETAPRQIAGWYVSSPVVRLESKSGDGAVTSVVATTQNSRWLIALLADPTVPDPAVPEKRDEQRPEEPSEPTGYVEESVATP